MKTVEGWDKKALRDLATINYGKSPIEILVPDGPYPVVGTGGTERLGNDYLYEGDSIILGRKGTIDRVHFATGRFWTIDTAYYLSDFAESVPHWLFYFLQTIDLRQMNEATGVPSLSRDALYKIEVPTPPKPEQTKIVEILSTVDRAIEETEALIAKQQRIKTGLMQDLLTRGIDEHGNLRSEQTHRFKDSPLGRIPVEWGATPLKDSVHIKHGYAFAGEFFSDQWNENVLLTPGNFHVKGGLYFNKSNTKYYIGSVPEEFVLSNGDVLVVMTDLTKEMAILGRTVVLHHPDRVLHNQRIGKVEVNRGMEMDLEFLALLMNSDFHRDSVKVTATGTTVRHTSPEKLLSPLIPTFGLNEQIRIRTRVAAIEEDIRSVNEKLAKTLRLKTALMQDLLTGKKRVTPLLTEVQEVGT